MEEMVTISKQRYEELKLRANIDIEFLQDLMEGFKDIKEGRFEKVK